MKKFCSLKTAAEQRRLSHHNRRVKFHIFSTVSLTAIFFTYVFTTNTFTSNLSTNFPLKSTIPLHNSLLNNQSFLVQSLKSINKPINFVTEVVVQEAQLSDDHNSLNFTIDDHDQLDILKSTRLTRKFEKRVQEFLKNGCKVRFFMTWISSSFRVFGEREFLAVDSLFNSNPDSCLMIISNTMDSVYGFRILKPVMDLGFRVLSVTPDFEFLFKNTPAESWFDHIKNGKSDPGEIPLAQNLSNLIRIAVLYKYGGVYLDTDFVILHDFSDLRNSIGAQSATRNGNWTRLNNAVLIFDKNHEILYKFMEEFALTFNGNKWGHNGPYLVSRVVEREGKKMSNLTILAPNAFYPVDWTRIGGWFRRPVNPIHRRWVVAKVAQLTGDGRRSTYGVHLWNKESRSFRIEQGSIMDRLITHHCVICQFVNKSESQRKTQIFSKIFFPI